MMTYGTKAKFARLADISPQALHNYLCCRVGASATVADRLAGLTGTDIRLWLKGLGGTPETRKAAIQAWADSLTDKIRN
jgi:hypothetical protein